MPPALGKAALAVVAAASAASLAVFTAAGVAAVVAEVDVALSVN